jgi:hypothetical protein
VQIAEVFISKEIPEEMSMRVLGAVVLLIALSGCQTKQIQEMNYTERKQLAAELEKQCLEQGVKAKSPEMSTCFAAEVQREQYTRFQNSERLNNGFAAMGQGISNASRSYSNAAQAANNRNISCTSQRYGTMVRTNCY